MNSNDFKKHLTNKILPFWNRLKDTEFGGFYGEMDNNLNVDTSAPKGMILHSRILWFYSNVYLAFKDPVYLDYAKHTYDFIRKYGVDSEYGGIYWMLSYDGKPIDTTKHSYNQAFAIYSLASFYRASGDKSALDLAYTLYDLLESKCKTELGYHEAFERTYENLVDNDKLSENGIIATRTMNTLLHIFEAYCELFIADNSHKVATSIISIYEIFCDKVYSPENGRLEVFFDDEYNTLIDLYSYGHDIEASWLLDRGLHIKELAIPEVLAKRVNEIIDTIVENIFKKAYDKERHALNAEAENGIVCTKKIWWVQAESVVGFYNGYMRTPANEKYKETSESIWQYIQNDIVDSRPDGEWFQEKDSPEGITLPVVSPWKCPYHNGRMCLEMIQRLEKF